MKVNNCSSVQAFGHLFYSKTIVENLKSEKFSKDLSKIKNIFVNNKFDKKRYVDVYLGYDDKKGFYGIISSKKQGIPNNPQNRCCISTKPKTVKLFKNWLNDWNRDYSPSVLAEFERLRKYSAKQSIKNQKDFKNMKKAILI